MSILLRSGALLAVVTALQGCAYDSFEHFAYDASHSRQCVQETGIPDCDPQRPSYQEYEKERQEILNAPSSQAE